MHFGPSNKKNIIGISRLQNYNTLLVLGEGMCQTRMFSKESFIQFSKQLFYQNFKSNKVFFFL